MPKGIVQKCRSCAKLPADEAIALHGTEGTGCWVHDVCPKKRWYYSNRDLINKKRRKGAANDPIQLLPPDAPAAILHLYRERVETPLHAVGAELWLGQNVYRRWGLRLSGTENRVKWLFDMKAL